MARRAFDDRSDYEAWFYSQAPTLDPHATGLGWNDYPAKSFALPERLHATQWTGDTAARKNCGAGRVGGDGGGFLM